MNAKARLLTKLKTKLSAERLEDRVTPAVVPFAMPTTVGADSSGAYSVELHDLNGDGRLDLLTGSYGDTSLAWQANLGGGSFGPRQIINSKIANPDSPYSFQLTAGDFNGDGQVDVATASDKVVVHFNTGSGTFGPAMTLSSSPADVTALEVADIDGDGKADLIVNSSTGSLLGWFRSQGNGSFDAFAVLSTEAKFPTSFTISDMNGDGQPDLVTADWINDARAVSWFANTGNGTFGPKQVIVSNTPNFRALTTADLNADGKRDILVTFEQEIVWLASKGDGTFAAPATVMSGFVTSYDVSVADFDNNGTPDVVAVDLWSKVVWSANRGDGTFGPATLIAGGADNYMTLVAVGDLDGDSLPDVVISDQYPSRFTYHENRFGRGATVLTPPPAGTYVEGSSIEFSYYVGYPMKVTGAPRLPLNVGGQTRLAEYSGGSDGLTLKFRYVVGPDDRDLDGVSLAGPNLWLNGGTITSLEGTAAPLGLPSIDLSGLKVNGSAPVVRSITRLDAAATAASKVKFLVNFSEAVSGVDSSDFNIVGDLTGASVTGVTGKGTTYTVTVTTGAGSGMLGLEVLNNGSISDSAGNAQGSNFSGGEVYTLHRRPSWTIDKFYTEGHGDIGVAIEDGRLHQHIHNESGEFKPDEVLVVVGQKGLRTTPTGPQWSFIGAGLESYWIAETFIAGNPLLGFSGEELPRGTFASYRPDDSRLTTAGRYVQLKLTAMRGPDGGHFSAYRSTDTGPVVWMATSDGIGATDVFYLFEGSHDHLNLTFNKPGQYEIDLVASGFRDANGNGVYDMGIDPYTESAVTTYYFSIDPPGGPQALTLPADPLLPVAPPAVVPFALPQVIGFGVAGGSSLTAVDLDGDGDHDIIAGAYGANKVVWIENLGAGIYGPTRVVDDKAESVWFTKPIDADNDGDLDIVAGMYSGTFAMYPNLGGGLFGSRVTIDTNFIGPWIVGADFDTDGKTDLVAAEDGGTELFLYRGLGGGTFATKASLGNTFKGLGGFQIADFDGDGDTDLAVGDYRADEIIIFINKAGVLVRGQTIVGGDGASADGLADINGDSKLDIISLEYNSGKVSWHAGNGDGTFGLRNELPASLNGPYAVKAGDFDGDGDADVAIATYSSSSEFVWLQNDGKGKFGNPLSISQAAGQVGDLDAADVDGDGDLDLIAHSFSRGETLLIENFTGQFATQVVLPTARTYLAGQNLDVAVHFGFPVTVTGSPIIDLVVGGKTVPATYLSGSGTPDLVFRYTVVEADSDTDGISMPPVIRLNNGSITNPLGNAVTLNLPATNSTGVLVNGSAPTVKSITRSSANPTNSGMVTFNVTFSEPVVNVTANDFLTVLGGVAGSSTVSQVTGSGASYAVTVSTGTGSGTIGLEVVSSSRILDAAGNKLGDGFAGGEVFTLRRSSERTIENFYTRDHGDIGINYADGAWDLHVHSEQLDDEFHPDEVLIYVGAEGKRTTPTASIWAFLGAGVESYWIPATNSIAEIPYLGIAAEEITSGTFAAYPNLDPRVNSTGSYVQLKFAGFRGPVGGQFSIYESTDTGPKVWVATSDGISPSDTLYLLEGSHNHFNLAFSVAGVYEVDFIASGYLDTNGNGTFDEGVDRYTESGVTTYYFGIDLPGGVPTRFTIPADALPVVPPTVPPVVPPVTPPVAPPTVPPVVPVVPLVPPVAVTRLSAVGAGSGGGPRVRVMDSEGTVVHDFFAFAETFTGGVTVATGDLTGDGVEDIIAGAGFGGGPHIRTFDGVTGKEIGSFFAFDSNLRGGVNLVVGDLDGDGVNELIVGAGAGGGPHVRVFNSRGQILREWFAFDANSRSGVRVAIGDINGDGQPEIMTSQGEGAGPLVRVFGKSDAAMTEFPAYASNFTGGVSIAAVDLNRDGRAELVTGAGPGGGPHIKVFNGETAKELAAMMVYPENFTGGLQVGSSEPGEIIVGPARGNLPLKRLQGLPLVELGEMEGFEAAFSGGVFVG
jgi:hypothetical protein